MTRSVRKVRVTERDIFSKASKYTDKLGIQKVCQCWETILTLSFHAPCYRQIEKEEDILGQMGKT